MSYFEDFSKAYEKKLEEDKKFRKKFEEGIITSLKKSGLESPVFEDEDPLMGKTLMKAANKKQVITNKIYNL